MNTVRRYFHGGIAGLMAGDFVRPAPPHVEDGCPICEAKRHGRAVTVGAYKRWLRQQGGPRADRVLQMLADAPDHEVIDQPRAKTDAVYVTAAEDYALWYAARSRGDLYEVRPVGDVTRSGEDNFPSFTCEAAQVQRVIRRGVMLTRTERRRIERAWSKADRKAKRSLIMVAAPGR